ncbi:hypothetical protein [Terasakiella sp.]|uniref:hypothetical protein n=1 Tax=Terasakiella sp. TaxID=2034861 RepID=UPI003AA7EDE0
MVSIINKHNKSWIVGDYAEAILLKQIERDAFLGQFSKKTRIYTSDHFYHALNKTVFDDEGNEKYYTLLTLKEWNNAFERLVSKGIIGAIRTPHAKTRYNANFESATAALNEEYENRHSIASLWKLLGDSWLWESVGECRSGMKESLPASDRTVSLDHNSLAYEEAVEAIDTIYKEVKEANDIDITSEEREQHLAELEASKKVLEAPQASINVLIDFVLRVVKYIADHFGKAALGELAKKVIAYITSLT